jgi:hypothetical protein
MIYPVLYAIACIGFAAYNNDLIRDGKRIYHAINGAIHLTAAILIGYFTNWQYGLAVLFIAKLFFDTSLNLMRGLSIDYISPEVKAYKNWKVAIQKGKFTDWLEYKLFKGNGIIPKILYALIIVILLTC